MELDYYLKVFLNQEVEPNLKWDIEMMLKLGELYPRQVKDIMLHQNVLIIEDYYSELEALLEGLDPFNKVFIGCWNDRVKVIDNWLKTLVMNFDTKFEEELYEIAVINIEKQQIVDYMFFYKADICIKLSKEQYLRFLKYHVIHYWNKDWINKKNWLCLLKEEVGYSGMADMTDNYDHARRCTLYTNFPQVFPALKLTHSNQVNFFSSSGDWILLDMIFKNYAINLFVKHYSRLPLNFFYDLEVELKIEKANFKYLPSIKSSSEELRAYAEVLFEPIRNNWQVSKYYGCYGKLESLLDNLNRLKSINDKK